MSVNKSTKRGPFRLLHSQSKVHPYATRQFMDEEFAPCNGWKDIGSSQKLELESDGAHTYVTVQPKKEDHAHKVGDGTILAIRQNPMDLQKWDWWTFQIAGRVDAIGGPDGFLEWEAVVVEESSGA